MFAHVCRLIVQFSQKPFIDPSSVVFDGDMDLTACQTDSYHQYIIASFI